MARIRSLKPEAFQSETLAEISLSAERTFYGMSTLADDHGRFADKPAQINGDLWSMRNACTSGTPHTPVDLEDELTEMDKAVLVCRYVGCDGKRYGHFMTWSRHQKIDKPSKPRYPRCPHHHAAKECGVHGDARCPLPESTGVLARVSRGLPQASEGFSQISTPLGGVPGESAPEALEIPPESLARDLRIAPDLQVSETSRGIEEDSRDSREGSMLDLGSRTEGSKEVPPSAAAAPRSPAGGAQEPETDPAEATAQTLVAEWIDHCRKRPPDRVIGQVSKELRLLLDEGHDVTDIRTGLAAWHQKSLHPSALASVVNELMNANPAAARNASRNRRDDPTARMPQPPPVGTIETPPPGIGDDPAAYLAWQRGRQAATSLNRAEAFG
jgi:hypothetical protein